MYAYVEQHNRTIQIYSPSLDIYEHLQRLDGIILQCPCAQLSVPYGNFLQLTPLYHPMCTSDFVSEKWITWLLNAQIYNDFLYFADFRITSPTIFQMLADLCMLVDEIVIDTRRLSTRISSSLRNYLLLRCLLFKWQVKQLNFRYQHLIVFCVYLISCGI